MADVDVFGSGEQGQVPALGKAAQVVQRLGWFGLLKFCPVVLTEFVEVLRIVSVPGAECCGRSDLCALFVEVGLHLG